MPTVVPGGALPSLNRQLADVISLTTIARIAYAKGEIQYAQIHLPKGPTRATLQNGTLIAASSNPPPLNG